MGITIPRGLTRRRQQTTVLRTARFAIAAMFFVNGAVSGNWLARIPAIQHRLELSNSELGVALLGMPVGMLLITPIAGWLIACVGSRPVVQSSNRAALVYCLTLPLLALAPEQSLLAIALVLFGAINGVMCLAMNAQGLALEQCDRNFRYMKALNDLASFNSLSKCKGVIYER